MSSQQVFITNHPFLMKEDATTFLNHNSPVITFKDMKLLTESHHQSIKIEFDQFYLQVMNLQSIEEVHNFFPKNNENSNKIVVDEKKTTTMIDDWLSETIFEKYGLEQCHHEKTSTIRGHIYETRTKLRALFVSILIQRVLCIRMQQFQSIEEYNNFFIQARKELEDLWVKYAQTESEGNLTESSDESEHTKAQKGKSSSGSSDVPSTITGFEEPVQASLTNFYITLREARFWRPRSDVYNKKTLKWEKFAMRVCSLAVNERIWYCPGTGIKEAAKLRLNIFNAFRRIVVEPEESAARSAKLEAHSSSSAAAKSNIGKKKVLTTKRKNKSSSPVKDLLTNIQQQQQQQQQQQPCDPDSLSSAVASMVALRNMPTTDMTVHAPQLQIFYTAYPQGPVYAPSMVSTVVAPNTYSFMLSTDPKIPKDMNTLREENPELREYYQSLRKKRSREELDEQQQKRQQQSQEQFQQQQLDSSVEENDIEENDDFEKFGADGNEAPSVQQTENCIYQVEKPRPGDVTKALFSCPVVWNG